MSATANPITVVPGHKPGSRWPRAAGMISGIAATVVATSALVYATGGVNGSYTYVMLLPLLVSAAVYGLRGGVITGVIGALLIGPFMPADVALGAGQSFEEWFVRLAVFALVGVVVGGWNDQLRRQARTERDALRIDRATGLPNQAAFMEDLALRFREREARGPELAVVLVRATDLTDIIDVTGIDGGERLLRALGDHVNGMCREVKGVYRFSASELGLIVEAGDSEEMRRLCRTLHSAAAASLEIDGAPMRIEPALGLGHTGHETIRSADELVRRARVALRRAMSLERDWVSYEPVLESDQSASVELIARAQKALESHEFELHYQPKIGFADRQPVGAEALIRWRRPGEGIVSPGSFMPRLERTSLIDTFSRFVIRTATDFARRGALVPVSINLAPRNLTDDTLITGLIEGLQQTGTPAEYLEVEVTESALMRDPEHAIASLGRLRAAGIGVSIDDFGTGYASFAYLRRLPATNMKIDRSFVRPLEGDPRTARLVLAMVEAGHALGLTVTAEGVETEEQARILTELGCDYGQGFLWSPARPEADLDQWLQACHPPGNPGGFPLQPTRPDPGVRKLEAGGGASYAP